MAIEFAFTASAQAQFFDSRGPFRQRPQRSGGFFDGFFGPSNRPAYEGGDSEREPQLSAPVDSSRAPSPRKPDKDQAPPTTSIVVLGDGMADWLAYGLEDAFGDAPEIGIIRKNKQRSGLLHYDTKGDLDWWHVARDLLAPEKPSYVVMMLGVSDRQNITSRDLAKEADKKEAEKKKADVAKDAAKDAAKPDAAKPEGAAPDAAKPDTDKSAQTKDAAPEKDIDEPDPIIAPEPSRGKSANGTLEFRTDQWAQVYSRRIDETVAALKSKGVPVFWVGLPAIKGPKSTADAVYLNDLYRARAEKAGAIYIDVWDGFVDEGGKFTTNGPDYEGQVRRLRSGDGVYFTKYGARKLAHYVERELRRYMSNRLLQVSLPSGPVAPLPSDGKSAARPLAGPVVPLTITPGNSDELLGGSGSGSAHGDAIATNVLVKGQTVAPPAGRADDFVWRQGTDANASVRRRCPSPRWRAIPVTTPAMTNSALTPVKEPDEAKPAVKTKVQRDDRPRTVQNAPPRQAAAPPQQRPPSNPFSWFR
ncbi:MAG: DUF459 domain-containing protein [Pseudolabrys sp.]